MTDQPTTRVTVAQGALEGSLDTVTGVRRFAGVPFAEAPVGELRWRPPQPPLPWTGVRSATGFGARAMQLPVWGDMSFRSAEMSEDCLFLNVWTPTDTPAAGLPVLVYFYGGGNIGGDGSEPRYDGTRLAARGVVCVTVNYRLGIFGFFAHPDLTAESPEQASGNYGYLDQTAALAWVHENIAAFGGDPGRVTIAGESAGSISVAMQMLSPLARGLFTGAIHSSGSVFSFPPRTLADAETAGGLFASGVRAASLAELRGMSATALLEATDGMPPQDFPGTVDGWFLPRDPQLMIEAGEQARVPLLVGWNSEEMPPAFLLGDRELTVEDYRAVLEERFGEAAEAVFAVYPAASVDDVYSAAADLGGDLFIGFSTWKWADLHSRTGGQPVYRYLYAHPRPAMRPELGNVVALLAGGVAKAEDSDAPASPPARGAVHSADIEYFMGTLATNPVYAWTAEDEAISELMQQVYVNFVTTGDPNGAGVPTWPAVTPEGVAQVMRLDASSAVGPDAARARYALLDELL